MRNALLGSLKKATLLLAGLFLWHEQAQATHAMGGDLTYECLGNNIYKVTLNFFRDCNGVAAPTNCNNGRRFRVSSATCSADFTACFTLESVEVITPICEGAPDRCTDPNGVYGVERYKFSTTIDLSPWAGCGADWAIDWELCCRNNAITSLNNPGSRNLFLSSTLNNTLSPCNDSPRFLNDPVPFGCVGQPMVYNHGVSDLAGDSLTFELAPARGNNGGLIPYNAGYSHLQPVVTNGGANAVQIDPVTGTISFVPSIQQFAVVTVLVKEYRNGVLIGTYLRDVQFAIIACANNNPSVSGINGTNNFIYNACAGESFCFTMNSADADAAQIVTMNWNNAIPGATFTTTNDPRPVGTFCWTPSVANIGTQLFTVTVEDDACELNGSATQGYVINILPPFTPANAGPDQSVCATTATLAAQLPYPQVQGTWSVLSGTGVFANPNDPTTTVSGLTQGQNVFRWTVDYQSCGLATDEVVITSYNPAQPAANAGSNQMLCTPNNQTTLNANAAIAPAIGTWTVLGGAGVFADPNSPTTQVTGLAVGVNTLRWTINNGPCGVPTSSTMTIHLYNYAQPAANAGPDQSFCSIPAVVQLGAQPNNGWWTVVAGTGVFADPTNRNTTVTGLSVGVNTFGWVIYNGPCDPPSTADQMNVIVYDPNSSPANAGPAQQVCSSTATLAGNTPIIPAVGTWSLVSGSGTIASPNSPNSSVTGLAVGSNVFQWSVNNGPCGVTTSQVTITRFDPNTPVANAGSDQSLCTASGSSFASTTLAGNAVTSPATGTWSVISGTATFANTNSATTSVSGLSVGLNILRWTIDNGPCGTATTDDVVITVYDRNAPAANAGADQDHCAPVASVSLTATAPVAPATGTWTVLSGSGVFADASSPTTTVTGMAMGNNVYRWTTSNGPCPGAITSDDVVIRLFDTANVLANAGPDQQLCGTGSTTLSGSTVTAPAAGLWTVVSGTGTIANPTNPAASVSGIPVGTTVFRWTVSNGPCGTSFDDVAISRFSMETPPAYAGPDQAICVPVSPNSVTMAASGIVFPAVGTWSQITGAATIVSVNSPNTVINDLTVGIHEFLWTVDNGACGGVTSDVVRINVHDVTLAPADAGPDQFLCTTSTEMAAPPLSPPATGQWALISGTAQIADPFDPATSITGLAVGQNIFQWTLDNGPCDLRADQMSIFVFDPDVPEAYAGPDQSLCTDDGNSITLQGSPVIFPATGSWTVSGGPATIVDPADPNTMVTDLEAGSYLFTWTVNNGACEDPITSSTMEVAVADGGAQPAFAGPDRATCGTDENVQMNANEPVFPATGSWSVVQGTATFDDPTSPTTIVSGLSIGINILEWSIDNLDCGITQDQVVIYTYDPENPIANAGPDQSVCTPLTSTDMNGSPLTIPAVGQWTLVSGAGTIADPGSPTTTISGLGLGENVFQWQVINGTCPDPISTDLVSIFLNDVNAPPANAGPDQQICTPASSVTMAANATVGVAVGTWTLINGGGTITSANDPNTSITGLPVGANVFQWTIDNGPCGSTSDQVNIVVYDDGNPVADAGADQELCTPVTSTTLAGSALIFPATGEWILVSGNGTITDPSDPNSIVTGLTLGENVFQWTVSNGPCADGITSDQVSIFLFDDGSPVANAGDDNELCSPLNEATLVGSAVVFPATGLWQVVSGSGTISDPTAQVTSVTDLGIGVNTFSYTVDNGACDDAISVDEVSILVYDENNPVADTGPDQELCSPTFSTTLAGSNVIVPAIGTWTLVAGSGDISDANDPGTAVTGLSIGENRFRWTVNNGPCEDAITFDEVSIFVFDENNPIANAGGDQQLCGEGAVASLQGSAVIFPATGQWTLVSGSGTITDPTSPATTVTALGFGDNVFEWTVYNGPCDGGNGSDQVTISLFDSNSPSPFAGPDQDLCTPQLSTTMQASVVDFPAFGTWALVSGSGTIADVNDPNTVVTGLAVGENVFTWTVFNGVCESGGGFDYVSIFVYDEDMPVADAGADQELCTADLASTTMNGSPLTFPATGMWTLVSGSGWIVSPGDPLTTVVDLAIGENIFEWTVFNGPCDDGITQDQVSIFVFDENNPVADAGADQDLCTPIASIQLQGSAVISPAIGTWTIVSGTGTLSDPNDPQAVITGASPGVIIVEWEVSNGPCGDGITSDQVVINLYDENTAVADAGPDQQLCTPETSTLLQGSAVSAPSMGTWQLVSGTGVLADPNDPTSAVTGLSVGENIFLWTVSNGPCDNAITTDQVSIFVFDENNADADAGPDQQVCTPLTNALMSGSAVTFPAIGTWTLVSGQGTIEDVNDPNTNIMGLGIGTNVFEWTVDNGACANGITTSQVTIVLFDADAPPADAGTDQQLCSPDDQVFLNANVPVGSAIGTWTVAQGTGDLQDVNDPNTQVTGLTIGENIFTWTLESGDCVTTSDQVSIFVFDPENPIADAGLDQQLCVPQDSVFMAASGVIFPATGTWTVLSGTGMPVDANDPITMFQGLSSGQNSFQWEVSNGPCPNGLTQDLVTVILYEDTTVAANAGPDLQTCIPILTVQLQGEMPPAPAVGTWTVIAGTGVFQDENDPTTPVSALSQGINTFVWTLEWDPCPNNGILTDTVNVYVYDPVAPIADAGPDQSICGPGVDAGMQANIPAVPGVGTWSVIQGNAFVNSVNDPYSMVSGLDVGVHTFLWTIYNGDCGFGPPSVDTMRIAIYDSEAPVAATGPDISLCTPANSAVLQANDPVFPATGEWVLIAGAGTFADVNDPLTAVYDIEPGQNEYRWDMDNGPCAHTSAYINVFLFDGANDEADAGPDQQLCTPETTTNMQGNPAIFPAVGTWTLISGTGVIDDPNMYNTSVSGLSIGANVFQWTIVNGPCGESSDEVVIMVYDGDHPPANAGADQQLCTPVSGIVLQGSPVTFPATGAWVIISGTGTISDPSSPNATVSGAGPGTLVLQWVVDNGPCWDDVTTDQVEINIFDGSQQAAAAGPDQSYCTPVVDAITMFANSPQPPATGQWTVISGPATLSSYTDPFAEVTGAGLGANIFLWTVENGACGTTSDEVGIFIYDHQAAPADAGPGMEFCQDITSTELQAVPPTSTSSGVWSLLSGNGLIIDPSDPSTGVTDLALGHNHFQWTVYNGPFAAGEPCGPTSDTLTILLQDCLTLRIPDAFSPNGDGVNDVYQIENILSYPASRLQVFNRWGNKVLDRSPYVNDWDGTSQFGAMFGERLPESTYYYVLELGNDTEAHTGFIFLRR